MASSLLREPFFHEMTDMSDLAIGETRLPMTGLVHGWDTYDKDKMNVSIITEDGKGLGLRVDKKLWNKSWKNVIDVGKVIEFEGNIVSGSRSTSFCVTTDSVPTLSLEDTFSFIRSDVPEDATMNCMIVVEYVKKLDNKPGCKSNAPTVYTCLTAKGESVLLKAFGGAAASRLEKCPPGSIIHVGPVKYDPAIYNERLRHNFTTNVNTAVHVYTGPINNGNPKEVRSSDDFFKYVTGDKITYYCVLLTDVKDGSAYLTDRTGYTTYPPHRVALFEVARNVAFKKGALVKITAIVYTYDSIRLQCVAIEEDSEAEVYDKTELHPFSKYRAMIRKRSADEMTSPGAHSQSSQKSTNSEPDSKKDRHE